MTALLESVERIHRDAQIDSAAAFRELVVLVANDDCQADPADVAETLRSIGKTADQLREAVNTFKHRSGLRDKITAATSAQLRRREIQAVIDAAGAELAEAQRRYACATQCLQIELETLDQLTFVAKSAKAELFRCCGDSALVDALNANQSEAGRFEGELRDAQSSLHRLQTQLAEVHARGSDEFFARDISQTQAGINRTKQRLADLQHAIDTAVAKGRAIYEAIINS